MKQKIKKAKIRAIGSKENPSYVIPIPKHKIIDGAIDPKKEYDIEMEVLE